MATKNFSPLSYTGRKQGGANKMGDVELDSTDFSISEAGKVSLLATSSIETLASDSGTVTPASSAITVSGSQGVDTSGSGSTLSVNLTAEGIRQDKWDYNYVVAKFHDSPLSVQIDGTVASGVDTEVNLVNVGDGIMFEQYNMGTQTIIVPIMETAGLEIGLDKTNNEGVQYDLGITSRSRCVFTSQTDACFVECTVALADASGVDPFYIGFRKQAARNSTLSSYTDYFVLGAEGTASPNKIQFQTNLNTGGAATTDSTDTWADAASKTIRVNVSALGVATGLIDAASPTTEPSAFTFDSGDVLMPFIYILHGVTSPGKINITSFKCGLQ